MRRQEEILKKPIKQRVFLKEFMVLFGVVIITLIIFGFAKFYEESSFFVLSSDAFLSLHTLLEMMGIVMAFSVFAITYYTSEKTKLLSMIIIACVFLAVSIFDLLHTLSYKGMPAFLTPSSPAKATTLWMASRLTLALGILVASLMSHDKKIKNRKILAVFITIILTTFIGLLIIYRPSIFPAMFIEGKGLTPLKINLEYYITGIFIMTGFIYFRHYNETDGSKAYGFIILGLLISAIAELAFTMYNNVYDTYNFLGHIYKFVAYYLFFRGLFVINIQKPYQDLSLAEQKLNAYVDDLERSVELRTKEILDVNSKLIKNLDDANHIQMALMTTDFPKIPGMDFAAKYLPCEQVGGDFYNVFRLDEDNIGILIGDVAGHGVSAAMINVFINQNMRFRAEYDDNKYRILTPRGVLMNLYYVYNNMSFPEEMYVVLFYGIYNVTSGELSYASAGMNTHPLLLKTNGDPSFLKMGGFPICKFGDFFKPSYETKIEKLSPGDTMVFYSDGLGEIDRERPDLFSKEKIMEYLKGTQWKSAEEISTSLLDAYNILLGDDEMLDDVTVLVVKTPNNS